MLLIPSKLFPSLSIESHFVYRKSQSGDPPTDTLGSSWLLPEKWAEMSWLSLVTKCHGSSICSDEKQLNVQVKQ